MDTLDHLILRSTGGDPRQTICSIDELAEMPAEYGNPETLCIRKEEESGVPLVFLRDIDEEVRLHRRRLSL